MNDGLEKNEEMKVDQFVNKKRRNLGQGNFEEVGIRDRENRQQQFNI